MAQEEKRSETAVTDYATLLKQAEGILEEEPWAVAAMSNLSALLAESMAALNWAGFYLMRGGRLVVAAREAASLSRIGR